MSTNGSASSSSSRSARSGSTPHSRSPSAHSRVRTLPDSASSSSRHSLQRTRGGSADRISDIARHGPLPSTAGAEQTSPLYRSMSYESHWSPSNADQCLTVGRSYVPGKRASKRLCLNLGEETQYGAQRHRGGVWDDRSECGCRQRTT